ncbi:GntT/GntP/DsdX family permease [Lysobacter brunescens]|uniref:Gluconate:H+ symporter n=1 Tax=Lysobacter brunescens TaxID=262323 RepID=A0ABW2YAZ0_9GAMM
MLPVFLVAAIAALLLLVLRFKLPAFLALMLVAIGFGLASGMPGEAVVGAIQSGMGGTLGFVAVVVGLGAMFAGLLEHAGGIRAIADRLLAVFGERRTGLALGVGGFVVAIPVFFDVAFILLVPLIHRLSSRSGISRLHYAIPLLAGLCVTHAFMPPHPGPVAVGELLKADPGWVIVMAFACGLPAMLVAGPLFARRFRHLPAEATQDAPASSGSDDERPAMESAATTPAIGFGAALGAVLLPVVLILGNTIGGALLPPGAVRDALSFIGHPFVALLIACLHAHLVFGVARRIPLDRLREIMTRALEPAGTVVLVTGAGGVFKQILVDSGVGAQLGASLAAHSLPIMPLAFLFAAIIRVAQGSATVAMITGASLVAPVLALVPLSAPQLALVVIAIASGATIASHVNDSGFWLVSRYLQINEADTLRSWTVASTLAGTTGFIVAWVLFPMSG